MNRKVQPYNAIKGLNKDLSISKFSSQFLYDSYNVRIDSIEDNTLMTITNEKGNEKFTIREKKPGYPEIQILGQCVGYCVIDKYLILFTTTGEGANKVDTIWRLEWTDRSTGYNLYATILYGNETGKDLNFSKNNLIETLGVKENDQTIKVYWVDNINQPRFINIADRDNITFPYENPNIFNFWPELQLKEDINITKQFSGGSFRAGTVQYAFTYWNKNGQETNIFYTSDIYYISTQDRVGSPEENINCSFNIEIKNIDLGITNDTPFFDYIRVYAIQRTSLDGTPLVRIVQDIRCPDTWNNSSSKIEITDTGIGGSTFDANALLYIGGEELVLGTISPKDNVLFAGNVKINRPKLNIKTDQMQIETVRKTITVEGNDFIYAYKPYTLLDTTGEERIRTWKSGEYYKFGIQFQYKNGLWSEVIPVVNKIGSNETKYIQINNDHKTLIKLVDINTPRFEITYSYLKTTVFSDIINEVKDDYKKFRILYVPIEQNRRIKIAQGVINGTLSTLNRVTDNTVYADYRTRPFTTALTTNRDSMSTFTKPILSKMLDRYDNSGNIVSQLPNIAPVNDTSAAFINRPINGSGYFMELSNQRTSNTPTTIFGNLPSGQNHADIYFIDTNIVSFFSPEVEYSSYLDVSMVEEMELAYLGIVRASHNNMNYRLGTISFTENNPRVLRDIFGYRVSTWVNVQGEPWVQANKKETYDSSGTLINTESASPGEIWQGPFDDTVWETDVYIEGGSLTTRNALTNFKHNQITNDIYAWNKEEEDLSKEYSRFLSVTDLFPATDLNNVNNNILTYTVRPPKICNNNITSIDTLGIINNIENNRSVYYRNSMDNVLADLRVTYDTCTHAVFAINRNKYHSSSTPIWAETIPDVVFSDYDGQSIIEKNTPFWLRTGNNNPCRYRNIRFYYDMATDLVPITEGTLGISGIVKWYWNDSLVAQQTNVLDGNAKVKYPYIGDINYLWIVDLKQNILPENRYSDNDVFVPCSEPVRIGTTDEIIIDRGDTFMQRYDYIRTYSKNIDNKQQHTEVMSVWLETFTNIDARYDSLRGQTIFHNRTPENIRVNTAYSQKDNFWQYSTFDEFLFSNQEFKTTFIWSDVKSYGEHIDSFLKLNMIRNYTVDGQLGDINRIVNFKNELFGFQDKGIFNILYNQRAMINTSIGQEVMLGSTGTVQGVKYISKFSGSSNKWSIILNDTGLLYIDSIGRDIMMLNDTPKSLTNELGFKVWSNQYLSPQEVYKLDSDDQFIANQDLTNDSIYFNSKERSLLFNTRLGQFESFTPHKDVPFMLNQWGEFISIRESRDENNVKIGNTELWVNNKGDYGHFYNEWEKSYIEYLMNPEPFNDKTFDNLQYRMDVFTGNNEYLPNETFEKIEFKNEFQQTYIEPNLKDRRNPNVRKKFRVWNIPIPRSARTLNRIRNPWIETKFTFNPTDKGNRFKLHDTLLSYTT